MHFQLLPFPRRAQNVNQRCGCSRRRASRARSWVRPRVPDVALTHENAVTARLRSASGRCAAVTGSAPSRSSFVRKAIRSLTGHAITSVRRACHTARRRFADLAAMPDPLRSGVRVESVSRSPRPAPLRAFCGRAVGAPSLILSVSLSLRAESLIRASLRRVIRDRPAFNSLSRGFLVGELEKPPRIPLPIRYVWGRPSSVPRFRECHARHGPDPVDAPSA